jgi:hypothetical protein
MQDNKNLKLIFFKRILVFMLSFIFFSCNENVNRTKDYEEVVNNWIGKQLIFPDIDPIQPISIDTEKKQLRNLYKIVLYTDSIGCTSCNLRLDLWNHFVKIVDSTSNNTVDFQFWFGPNNNQELLSLFEEYHFRHVFYYDDADKFNQINRLPDHQNLRCFLLDSTNNVLLVGNPITNNSLWKLYLEQVKHKSL